MVDLATPEKVHKYALKLFFEFAPTVGIDLTHKEDWLPWFDLYLEGIKQGVELTISQMKGEADDN